MFLSLIPMIGAHADLCPALTNGVVLSKYYIEGCGACNRIAPEIERVMEKLKESNIKVKYREVECNECECEGITSFPTLAITEDKEEKGKAVGYKTYESIGKWMSAQLQLDPMLFVSEKRAVRKLNETEPAGPGNNAVVRGLSARDFLSGFDGQWLILFYESKYDPARELLKKIAAKNKGALQIGEVSKAEAASVINRYNVTEYPFIMGLNHGNVVPYAGERNERELTRFADRLEKPSFESISYKQLLKTAARHSSGEPVYLVLYKNYELASHYFNDLAQQFKFRATIYKSNDPLMFEAAGVHPKDYSDFPGAKKTKDDTSTVGEFHENRGDYNEVNHNEMVKLLVYKNGTFFASHVPLENGNEVIQWIFHTHFAHVTDISNENFYTVFHGIKPVLILLTADDHYLEEFNKVSADKHLGTAYTSVLFATLNVAEYPLFKNQVLPLVKTPALAFYDPVRVKWFVSNRSIAGMSSSSFSHEVEKTIDEYVANKLPVYPPKPKSRMPYYMLGVWAILIAGFFCFKVVSDRSKID